MHGLIWEWTSDYKSWGFARFGFSTEDSARFCGGGGNKGNVQDYIAFMRYGFRQSLSPQFTVSSLGFRCARDATPTEAKVLQNAPSLSPLPDSSLYRLTSMWRTDAGDSLQLSQLRGKPRLFSMFFSRCESVCPMLLGQLKGLESHLPPDLRQAFGFVMITFDMERDSLQALQDYRGHMGLDSATWQILKGDADDTRELALMLGVEYQPGLRGQIDHNGLIALLDADGKVVKRVSRIEDRAAFIESMRSLVNQPRTGGAAPRPRR
jgi:protein SCO1/2